MGAAGADVAVDSADVVLFTTDLRRLGSAMRIARSARRKIGQNIACAVAAKVRIGVAPLHPTFDMLLRYASRARRAARSGRTSPAPCRQAEGRGQKLWCCACRGGTIVQQGQ